MSSRPHFNLVNESKEMPKENVVVALSCLKGVLDDMYLGSIIRDKFKSIMRDPNQAETLYFGLYQLLDSSIVSLSTVVDKNKKPKKTFNEKYGVLQIPINDAFKRYLLMVPGLYEANSEIANYASAVIANGASTVTYGVIANIIFKILVRSKPRSLTKDIILPPNSLDLISPRECLEGYLTPYYKQTGYIIPKNNLQDIIRSYVGYISSQQYQGQL